MAGKGNQSPQWYREVFKEKMVSLWSGWKLLTGIGPLVSLDEVC